MSEGAKKLLSLALAGSLVVGVPVTAHAADDTKEGVAIEDTLETTNYIVKEGDTLGKIAEKFYGNSGYWEQLAEYNKMERPSELYPGQIVTIPNKLSVIYDYGNNVVNTEVNVYPEDKTYTVKEGDTMYCIVRVQYGLTNQEAVDKLATYNNLGDPNRISRGQVLLIPCLEKLQAVVQNDYTAEYNRMGWILNHPEGCKPCKPCKPCDPKPCDPKPCVPGCPQPTEYILVPVYPEPVQPCGPCMTLKP